MTGNDNDNDDDGDGDEDGKDEFTANENKFVYQP